MSRGAKPKSPKNWLIYVNIFQDLHAILSKFGKTFLSEVCQKNFFLSLISDKIEACLFWSNIKSVLDKTNFIVKLKKMKLISIFQN